MIKQKINVNCVALHVNFTFPQFCNLKKECDERWLNVKFEERKPIPYSAFYI